MKPFKILIVDDNNDNVYSLKKTLARTDYEFFEAHNSDEALQIIESGDPDILLLDVRLPGLDGFAVCEIVRKVNKHLPIVFVTANLKEFVDQVHGFEKGGDDYVIQPYDPKELIIKVKALLRNKRLYDELLNEVQKLDQMKANLQTHNEELVKVKTQLEEKNEYLKSLSITDPLTSLYNRKYFHQRIEKEISAVRRYKHQASVALVDIVGYRKINEEYGSQQADVLLKEMASLLVNSVRISDIVTRFDGGKFALIFTHTPDDNALVKCKMIFESVQNYQFPVYEDLIPRELMATLPGSSIKITAAIAVIGLSNEWIKHEANLIEALEVTLQQNKQLMLDQVLLVQKT